MNRPLSGPELAQPPELSLAEAYMQLIAQEETIDHRPTFANLPKGSTKRASIAIGRACVINQTDPAQAVRIIHGVNEELSTYAPAIEYRRAAMLIRLTEMLEYDQNSSSRAGLRRSLHGQSIASLVGASEDLRSLDWVSLRPDVREWKTNHLFGERVEYRMLSMLTRLRDKSLLSVPALVHHDSRIDDHPEKSFDQVLVEWGPHTEVPLLHKIQAKAACFGQCNRTGRADKLREKQQAFEELRARYAPDITLLSGCCDFQLSRVISPTKYDRMLFDEWNISGDKRTLNLLDDTADRLLMIATSGEAAGRNGTFPVVEESLTASFPRIPG